MYAQSRRQSQTTPSNWANRHDSRASGGKCAFARWVLAEYAKTHGWSSVTVWRATSVCSRSPQD